MTNKTSQNHTIDKIHKTEQNHWGYNYRGGGKQNPIYTHRIGEAKKNGQERKRRYS